MSEPLLTVGQLQATIPPGTMPEMPVAVTIVRPDGSPVGAIGVNVEVVFTSPGSSPVLNIVASMPRL